MARRRRNRSRARIVLLSGCGSARIASSARLGYRSRRFGAGRKPTWMVASSACSRTGGRAARRQEADQCRGAARDREADSPGEAKDAALERTHVGRGDRRRPHDRATRLEGAWPQAASDTPIPIERSKVAEKVVDVTPGSTSIHPTRQSCSASTRKRPNSSCWIVATGPADEKKGRAQTMTHDYKRNGTTTLFAALDVKTARSSAIVSPATAPRNSSVS